MKYKNGDTYTGEFQNEKVHGKGTMKYKNGDTYTGEFENGKFHGKGTYIYDGGKKIFKGEFSNGHYKRGRFLIYDVPTRGGRSSSRLQQKESSEVCQTPKVCQDLAMNELSKTEIDEKNRALVRFLEKLVGKDAASIQVSDVRISDLEALINKIDALFLLGSFQAVSYTVCWEHRQCMWLPGWAGQCLYPTLDKISIELNPVFMGKTVYPSCIFGVRVDNFAMALIVLLQHEMIHAIIRYYCKGERRLGNYSLSQPKQRWCTQCKSFDRSHSQTFMSIARNRFGHTHHKHFLRRKCCQGKS